MTEKQTGSAYAEQIRKAAELYDIAETLCKIRWENGAAFELHRATFDRTQSAIADIAAQYGKTHYDVLSDVRKVSRL